LVKHAQLLAIGTAALAMLVASIIGLLIARSISRPILTITEAMRQLAEGKHEIDLPKRGGRDEVGRMARAVEVFKENAIKVAGIQGRTRKGEARSRTGKARDNDAAC
jgi:methyl-accepting chemotaxis protein